jgi:hypothetical protein
MTDTDLEDEVLKWPIERLDFSTRVENCVQYYANVRTVGDLVTKTRSELMDIRSFGERSLEEVERKIGRLGLRLGMRPKADASLPCQQIVARITGERDEARHQADRLMDDCIRLLNERNAALKERDEAQREVCVRTVDAGGNPAHAPLEEAIAEAKRRGWKCYRTAEDA